jgi:hypothetical protein
VAPITGLTDRQKLRVQPDLLNLGSGSGEQAARGRMYLDAGSHYGLHLSGPPVSIYYDLDFEAEYWDAKVVLPLEAKPNQDIVLADNTVMQWETIPGLPQAAIYIFSGQYSQLPEQLLVVERWMSENGYRRGQQSRAVFHRGPMHFGPQSEFVTEIQIEILPRSEEK